MKNQPAWEESAYVLNTRDGSVLWQDVADRELHWLRALTISDDGEYFVLVRPRAGIPAWPVLRVFKRNSSGGYSFFADYSIGNYTSEAPHPSHVVLSADYKWLAVAHRINIGIPGRGPNYMTQAVTLMPFPPPAGMPWVPAMTWRSPYKPATGGSWMYTNVPGGIAVGATGTWVALSTWGCSTPAEGPINTGCTGVPTVFAFKRGSSTVLTAPAAVLSWSTPGSMFGAAVKELPSGGVVVAAGGRKVHANIAGQGADVFGWLIEKQAL